MSYHKQEFTNGQVLEAFHLNHIENGIGDNDIAIETLQEEIAILKSQIEELQSGLIVTSTRGEIVNINDAAACSPKELITYFNLKKTEEEIESLSTFSLKHTNAQMEEQTYTINLNENVPIYGGYFNWKTGLLTITHWAFQPTSGTLDSRNPYNTTTAGVPYLMGSVGQDYKYKYNGTVFINNDYNFVFSSGTAPSQIPAVRFVENGVNYFIYNEEYTSKEVAMEKLDASGMIIYYELRTPITIQYVVPPISLVLSKGENTFETNADEIELVYIVDTKLYLDKLLSTNS